MFTFTGFFNFLVTAPLYWLMSSFNLLESSVFWVSLRSLFLSPCFFSSYETPVLHRLAQLMTPHSSSRTCSLVLPDAHLQSGLWGHWFFSPSFELLWWIFERSVFSISKSFCILLMFYVFHNISILFRSLSTCFLVLWFLIKLKYFPTRTILRFLIGTVSSLFFL